ncbi:hypothetical protein BJ166DRAFT_629063 [Pestalotiopsis sp. NC0098]|nr:hypothetical protein BJ166DRAFT_629063 [Pestalotiopsis sp. NC0098]
MSSNYKSILKSTKAREPLRTYNQAESEQAWHTPPMEPDAFAARVFEDRLTKLKARRNRRKTEIRNEYKILLHDATQDNKTADQCIQLVEERMKKMNEIEDLFDARECSLKEERSRASRSPARSPEASPDSNVAEPRVQKKNVSFETTANCLETGMPVEPHDMGSKTWGLRQVQKMRVRKMRGAAEEIQHAERNMKTSLEAYSRSPTPRELLKHIDTIKDAQKVRVKFFELVQTERDRGIEPRKQPHRRHRPRHRDCYCRLRRDVKPVPALSDRRREAAQPLENPVHTPVNAGGSVEDNRYAAYNTGAYGQDVENHGDGAYNAAAYGETVLNYGYGAHGMGANGGNVENNYNGAYNTSTNTNYGYNAYNAGANANHGENNYNVAYNTGTNANYGYNAYNAGANANYGYSAYNAAYNPYLDYGYEAYNVYNPPAYAAYHAGLSHAAHDRNAYSGSNENNHYAASNLGTNGGARLDEAPGHPVYMTLDEYANVENYGYEVDMDDSDEDVEWDGSDGGDVENNGHSASGMGTNGGASLNEGPAGRLGARARHDDAEFSPSSPEMPTKRRRI